MLLLRQTHTLVCKTLLITLSRHRTRSWLVAFIIPIILTAFLAFARNLFVPDAQFGIGHVRPLKSLPEALKIGIDAGRKNIVFINQVHDGVGSQAVDQVIDLLKQQAETVSGASVTVWRDDSQLPWLCRASLRGVTPCFGAIQFKGAPGEDGQGMWNYTIRADGALGFGRIYVKNDDNDAEVYMLPLQRAVDMAIAKVSGIEFPELQDEYPFTSMTQDERRDYIRQLFQDVLINWLGVTFIVAPIFVVYHLAGFVATERESGISTLIDAMMAAPSPWLPQAARLMSNHIAFSLVYLPGWIVSSLTLWSNVYRHTSAAIVLIHFVLSGLALASLAILGASFFKKAQLSGVSITIILLVLAIIAQLVSEPNTATVVVLSLLFAPCNFTFFIIYLSRWEKEQLSADLSKVAPESPWNVPGIVFWIFLIIQIFVYPIIGAFVERWLHGTASSSRNIVTENNRGDLDPDVAVRLNEFTKIYSPGPLRRTFAFISKPKDPVIAVNKLSLSARRGQILALLGANGSGKSTTLDTIAGINKATAGSITIDGTGGLGIAPQKNVLWDELTVEEHIRIFNRLKSPDKPATKEEIRELVKSIDLEQKRKAQSRTLSGGQKRKLQLGMMLTGGSAVCCVDEVSSGLDPLSRRKIWDILLAERGKRTILLTTHFLDEADLLADYIAVMSRGTLRAHGSSAELKARLGGGYRIHVNNLRGIASLPEIEGVTKKASREEAAYVAPSSTMAAAVIKQLEAAGITDYRFSGPTIEDVFLTLAEEMQAGQQSALPSSADDEKSTTQEQTVTGEEADKCEDLQLLSGQPVGFLQQAWVLFRKRVVVLKSNWFPTLAAFAIPVIAAGLVMQFVKDQKAVGCSPVEQSSKEESVNIFASDFELFVVGGPDNRFTRENLARLFAPIFINSAGGSLFARDTIDPTAFLRNITAVPSLDAFNQAVVDYRKNITPAAVWLGDGSSPPLLAYRGNGAQMVNAWLGQWLMDMMLANTTIASSFVVFDTPFAPGTGNSLQLLVYLGLALCAYPAFFALYPNLERRRFVRGLQYSNGVRPLPLWLAYTLFDFLFVLVGAVIGIALFAGINPDVWYHVGYLFLVLILYGLASILLAYNIALFTRSQLAAYAFTAAGQVVALLLYIVAYMCVIAYAPVHKVDEQLVIVHFTMSLIAPITSVVRTLFVGLNIFSTACNEWELSTNPGGIMYYGGPIVYLIGQSIVLFFTLVYFDGGSAGYNLRRIFSLSAPSSLANDSSRDPPSDEEVAAELLRIKSTTTATDANAPPTDGLRVLNITKTFGRGARALTAVDNVTFGIPHDTVFALLGPNGAGKSTTISLIRGDISPSPGSGDILIENESVTRNLAAARAHLGVCPQFDAIDLMTVQEHLEFYARVRGVPDVKHNVDAVIRAVGLEPFRTRAAHALSGGNKRKLSLGIALMGNPAVVLLDEPSSGLDAAAKRVMWRTLAATGKGRSLLLTTHSMEEADALASKVGILARRMLAMGSVEGLRRKWGERLYCHVVCADGVDVERVRSWVKKRFGDGVEMEERSFLGQVRFSVPIQAIMSSEKQNDTVGSSGSVIGRMVVLLEEQRAALGIEHYSVSPATLDEVFLAVVGKHNVREEGYEAEKEKRWWDFSAIWKRR